MKRTVLIDMPPRIKGMTVKSYDGDDCYTILLNARLSSEQQRASYEHEMQHIEKGDYVSDLSVDYIEYLRHM